ITAARLFCSTTCLRRRECCKCSHDLFSFHTEKVTEIVCSQSPGQRRRATPYNVPPIGRTKGKQPPAQPQNCLKSVSLPHRLLITVAPGHTDMTSSTVIPGELSTHLCTSCQSSLLSLRP